MIQDEIEDEMHDGCVVLGQYTDKGIRYKCAAILAKSTRENREPHKTISAN